MSNLKPRLITERYQIARDLSQPTCIELLSKHMLQDRFIANATPEIYRSGYTKCRFVTILWKKIALPKLVSQANK